MGSHGNYNVCCPLVDQIATCLQGEGEVELFTTNADLTLESLFLKVMCVKDPRTLGNGKTHHFMTHLYDVYALRLAPMSIL